MGGVPIKATFSQVCWGDFFWKKKFLFGRERELSEKKKIVCRENKKTYCTNSFQKQKGRLFPFPKKNQSVQTKKNIKKSLFFIVLLLNIALKPTRFKDLNFQAKNKSKRWTPSERRINTASTSFSTPFFIIFLFCLISYLIQFIFIFVLIIY